MLRKRAGRLLVVDELSHGRMVAADRAVRISWWQLDRVEVSLERIERKEPSRQKLAYAADIFYGLKRLEAAYDASKSADDAGLLAGRQRHPQEAYRGTRSDSTVPLPARRS